MRKLVTALTLLALTVGQAIADGPCDPCQEVAEALERPGLSHADLTADEVAHVDVDDFYFAPRLAEVREGQTIAFTNVAPEGGNRHSVSSADLGGPRPVLPVPVVSFGGGEAFRSERLQPGTTFLLEIDLSTMNPSAYVALPGGDVLIGYFCYIHGAAQMNGQLLVRRA